MAEPVTTVVLRVRTKARAALTASYKISFPYYWLASWVAAASKEKAHGYSHLFFIISSNS